MSIACSRVATVIVVWSMVCVIVSVLSMGFPVFMIAGEVKEPSRPLSLASLIDESNDHQQLIDHLVLTRDWRLLRFLLGRSGISTAWNEAQVQSLASRLQQSSPLRVRLSLHQGGLIWERDELMNERFRQWQEIVSNHHPWQFRNGSVQLLGIQEDEALLSRLAAALPMVQALHRKYFPFRQKQERPVHIRLFTSREKYDSQDFRKGSYATFRPRNALVALWIDRQAYAKDANAEAVRLIQALCHELWHAYIQYHAPGMPVWMEEGLAEIFESALVRGDRALEIGPHIINPTNLQVLLANLAVDQVIPIATMMEFSNQQFATQAQVAYPQAWSVMQSLFFADDPAIADIVPGVVRQLRSGSFGSDAVIAAVGGIDWGILEDHWRASLEQQRRAPLRPHEYPPSPLQIPSEDGQ